MDQTNRFSLRDVLHTGRETGFGIHLYLMMATLDRQVATRGMRSKVSVVTDDWLPTGMLARKGLVLEASSN